MELTIPRRTQIRWYCIKKAGVLNSITIARWFARNTPSELFKSYRDVMIRLRSAYDDGNLDDTRYITSHNTIAEMMLDDICRLYGNETWRIVRNNITFIKQD